jgi:cell division protease FtsH
VRPALRALGELLVGVAERDSAETADRFTARCLGVADCGHLLDEECELNPVSRLTIALALAEWIHAYAPTNQTPSCPDKCIASWAG